MTEYPDHCWQAWKFPISPNKSDWWITLASRFISNDIVAEAVLREFVGDIARQNSISSLNDWNSAFLQEIFRKSAKRRYISLLGGLPTLLRRLYPSHSWKFGRTTKIHKLSLAMKASMRQKPASYWNKENIYGFVNSLKLSLGGKPESLYKLTPIQISTAGGSIIFSV